MNMDPQLVDKIVHEVKSQGVFDEFRKSSMADVDTKPAYQNLRQRVETTVKRFLSDQRWSPEMNKNQLRERLRKHITDSGFLDVGVERIVDQVVNPKIGTVFQPKIEDIAYKYLGVAKPVKLEVMPLLHQLPAFPVNGNSLKIETLQLLPNDLEQISPDSDKGTVKSECKDGAEIDIKAEEDEESPPFEPLEKIEEVSVIKKEVADKNDGACEGQKDVHQEPRTDYVEEKTEIDSETQDNSSVSQKTDEPESDKDVLHNPDVYQESHSQLSLVSSNSCLSVETHDIHNISREFNNKSHDNAVNISEEAQMPKFSENSNEENTSKGEKLHFDIKQDEIKFEGTQRNNNLQPVEIASLTSEGTNKDGYMNDKSKETHPSSTHDELGLFEKKDAVSSDLNFKFRKIYVEANQIEQPAKEVSLSESLDDSETAQLCIVDKSENTQISASDFNPSNTQKSVDKDTLGIGTKPIPDAFSALDAGFTLKTELDLADRGEESINVSPSISRHKKHSKQRRSEKERYREKDRQREKEKSGHRGGKSPSASASKHSSSSSKNRSSSKPSSCSNKESSASASQLKSKHSSGSSRSKTRDDSKRSGRDADKRQHSSSSSHKKSEKDKKQQSQNDDHCASKEKIHWRKSTDSNDEDKKPSESGSSVKPNLKTSDTVKSSAVETKGKYKNGGSCNVSPSSSNTAKCMNEVTSGITTSGDSENVLTSKIVILNEILENPLTDFVQLSATSQETHMLASRLEDKSEKRKTEPEYSDKDLLYFEQHVGQFNHRLKLIDNAIDSCRKVVNCLRFDSISPSVTDFANDFSEMVDTSGSYFLPTGTKRYLNCDMETTATLHIDCIPYSKTSHDQIDFEENMPIKRFKYSQSTTKMASPTSSEASVNSKENEFVTADISAAASDCSKKSISIDEKRNNSFHKLSQQRYTSDDLYKPRIFLGQRSRRRGLLDTIV